MVIFIFGGAEGEGGGKGGLLGLLEGQWWVPKHTLLPACKMHMTKIYKVYVRTSTKWITNTGRTAKIYTGGCSRAKNNTPVVRVCVRRAAVHLFHTFFTFQFVHHIRTKCLACRTPVSPCCAPFSAGGENSRDAPFSP